MHAAMISGTGVAVGACGHDRAVAWRTYIDMGLLAMHFISRIEAGAGRDWLTTIGMMSNAFT
jgi:hypothetical protein